MRWESVRQSLWSPVLAGLVLCAGALARAEDPPEAVAPPSGESGSEAGASGRRGPRAFWLGLNCETLPDIQRQEWQVPGAGGLVVEDVMPQSPAEAAGLKSGDVLLKAGDRPLVAVADLVAAVEAAAGQEFPLELWRGGETLRLGVTPAPRPRLTRRDRGTPLWEGLAEGLPEGLIEGIQEALRGMRDGEPGEQEEREIEAWRLGPGVFLADPIPDDLSITITRKGREPVRIVVERGSEKWETTADQIESLPEDVRPFVERQLGPALMLRGRLAGEEAQEVARRELDRARRELDRVRRRMHSRLAPPAAPAAPGIPSVEVPAAPPGAPQPPPLPGVPVPSPGPVLAPPHAGPPPEEVVRRLEQDIRRMVEGALGDLARRIEEVQRERGLTEEHLSQRLAELEARLREREPELRQRLEETLNQKGAELGQMIEEQVKRLEGLVAELAKAAEKAAAESAEKSDDKAL